jgi:thioredoxin-related protein
MLYFLRRLIYALLTTFLVLSVTNCGGEKKQQESSYVPVTKFDPERNPFNDLRDAVKEATKTNKRIILDVGGDWCSWCFKLDHLYEQNPDLNKYLHDHFIVVKINYSKENKNEKFLAQYPKIPGYPHLFVLESDGTFLHSQDTSKLEKGKAHDKDKVFAFLKEWAKKI